MDLSSDLVSNPFHELLIRASQGESAAWQQIVNSIHSRLRRMVAIRLDARLMSRLDPSDVLQDAYVDAVHQLPDYLKEQKFPFFLWMRLLVGHRLNKLHRYHLGTQTRDASREISLFHGFLPEASSAALAAQLIGPDPQPEQIALRAERVIRIQSALAQLNPLDREVLSLRHFEYLTTSESAAVLGITEAAAGQRYLRALSRIGDILKSEDR